MRLAVLSLETAVRQVRARRGQRNTIPKHDNSGRAVAPCHPPTTASPAGPNSFSFRAHFLCSCPPCRRAGGRTPSAPHYWFVPLGFRSAPVRARPLDGLAGTWTLLALTRFKRLNARVSRRPRETCIPRPGGSEWLDQPVDGRREHADHRRCGGVLHALVRDRDEAHDALRASAGRAPFTTPLLGRRPC